MAPDILSVRTLFGLICFPARLLRLPKASAYIRALVRSKSRGIRLSRNTLYPETIIELRLLKPLPRRVEARQAVISLTDDFCEAYRSCVARIPTLDAQKSTCRAVGFRRF